MKAVVLAAGEGRRLRPLTGNMGKGMLPVGNRPILEYVLEALREVDIRDIILVVGYQKEKVMNRFGDGKDLDLSIEYVEQKFQLGTAHALFQASGRIDGRFLVAPGDSLVDPRALKNLLTTPDGEWGILAAETSNSSKYGALDVKGDRLVQIRERQKLTEDLISSGTPSSFTLALWEYQDPSLSTLINTGTYMLDTEIFDSLEARGLGERLTLTSCITDEARKRKIRIKRADRWLDAVYPWDLLALNEYALSRTSRDFKGTVEEGVVMKGPVRICEGARIRANSVLVGPISIGKDTEVGPSAYIGANVSIGDNCKVGPFSVVKDSIVMDDVTIGSHSSIHQSIAAQGSTLGDFLGAEKCEYTIRLERYTATKTLGVIIGSDCEISHHVSLFPGVILGNGCRVGPMKALRDNLPDGTNVV
ncbi:MAG: NTP transferase domain-containing protein [Candidatus Thermoplasmatota archaeon]|nr:NTP transferase domain-containing protein [Candidatus Thermoplasmatota archaeon]